MPTFGARFYACYTIKSISGQTGFCFGLFRADFRRASTRRGTLRYMNGTSAGTGCQFETVTGFCGEPVRARGYCSKHYKVMNRKGAFKPAERAPLAPGATVTDPAIERNLNTLERARLKLEGYSEELIDCLVLAAKVAASKGNSAPAENALLHARVLAPIATPSNGKDTGGIRVLVGVQLGTTASVPGTAVPATLQNVRESVSLPTVQTETAGPNDRSSVNVAPIVAEVVG